MKWVDHVTDSTQSQKFPNWVPRIEPEISWLKDALATYPIRRHVLSVKIVHNNAISFDFQKKLSYLSKITTFGEINDLKVFTLE